MGKNWALEVKNLQAVYQKNNTEQMVVENIQFTIPQGSCLTLLGASGSGKSTIAKALMGLLPPSAKVQGQMCFADGELIELQNSFQRYQKIRGKKIAMIFQDARQSLNPAMKIKKQFAELLDFYNMARGAEAWAIMESTLRMLNFKEPEQVLDSYPFELSGGMCQRVCIAMAICLKPQVLIADEPTSALDVISQKEVLILLKKVQRDLGQSLLMITHDRAVARAISDQVIVLANGSMISATPKDEFWKIEQELENEQACSKLPSPATLDLSDSQKEPVLQIECLQKTFVDKEVLSNIELAVYENEVVGILGESGCGKSTLSRCIIGLENFDQGEIKYAGECLCSCRDKNRKHSCQDIQMIFQDARASLNPRYKAKELVSEPLQYHGLGDKSKRLELAEYYLEQVGITGASQNRKPPQLSTGQCQRIAIARALVLQPKVLICDEAVSALDEKIQNEILLLLKQLQQQFSFSILMISHDIRILRSFCHRIAVMLDGNFCEVVQNPAHCVQPNHPYTKLLFSYDRDLVSCLQ